MLSNRHTTKVIFADTVKITPSSKTQYQGYKIPAVTPVRSQTNLYHTFTSYLFTIYFNIVFSFRVRLQLTSDFFLPVPPSLPENPSNSECISYTSLTYSMEQGPSWEANWFAASQEIPRVLWNPKVPHRLLHITLPNCYHYWAYPKFVSYLGASCTSSQKQKHFPLVRYLNKVVNSQFNNTDTCAVVALCRTKLQIKMNSTIPKSRILENGLPLKNNFTLNPESLFLIYT
jgi:hypothetical protein